MISSAHAPGYRRRFSSLRFGSRALVFDCRIPYIYKKNAAETPSRNFYRKVSKEIKCVKENFIVIYCCTTNYN